MASDPLSSAVHRPPASPEAGWGRWAWPALVWAAGAAAMGLLDGELDLANLALLLVLTSAVAALWLPGWASAGLAAVAVATFNWAFVPPRRTFAVDLHQHALLLAAMLAVNWIIAALVIRQRRLVDAARRHARREQRLRAWGDTLRDASDPGAHAAALHAALAEAAGVPVVLQVRHRPGAASDDDDLLQVGEADADQQAGLALCEREGRPLGPGRGRYEGQPDVYLPLRGRAATLGAAVLCGLGQAEADPDLRPHLQALCDQFGGVLQRWRIARDEREARAAAEQQGVRNALLAAISHDYRTPLATIMGAASSLREQGDQLDAAQRRRLAGSIVDEAERLARLADNTLQLARLDHPGVRLRCDWESAEEIVGTVLRHARRRPDGDRLRARLEPGLPLLWCDALLVAQLLENLVDNALKYSPPQAPVELLVRQIGGELLLAVRDRGPGIAPAWRERVFEVFHRGTGEAAQAGQADRANSPDSADQADEADRTGRAAAGLADARAEALAERRPGAGVGLAVCRAIAQAHGGEIRLRPRAHGGCAFEFLLPLRAQPEAPP